MASDYGDEAGSKMIDDFMRFGERMGERAMYARAGQMQRAFQNATREARATAGEDAPAEGRSEWAKLDMHEFQGIEDYEAIKGIIEDRLASHGVGSTWFPDPETGKEYLLFRIADAREVWPSFEELSRETDDACAKAAERIRERSEREPAKACLLYTSPRRNYGVLADGGRVCSQGLREAAGHVAYHHQRRGDLPRARRAVPGARR